MNRAIATVGLILWCGALPVRAADPAGEQTDQPIVVPFELLKTMHMAVKIKVNGKGPYRVIFDTGARVNLLNNKIAHAANLLKKSDMPFFTVFGSNGPVLVRTFEVGKLKAADVPAIVMDHPALETASQILGPIEGIVGFPLFARYRLTLDYKARTMTFVPNGYKPPDVLQALMAGMMDRRRRERPSWLRQACGGSVPPGQGTWTIPASPSPR